MNATELDLKGPTTLVVAWRTGHNAHGRTVKAGGAVIDEFRTYAADALDIVRTNSGRVYDPNDEQDEDDDAYLETSRDELLDTALLEELLRAASLPQATTDDLRRRSLALYALVVGSDPARLTAFVRRGNPVKLANKGLVAVFDDTLVRVERPLLAFDNRYDVIIYPGQVHILSQKNFEALFKESDAVLAKTAEWAESFGESLPISDESKEWLAARLRANSVMRRRVQSILKSDYLTKLTQKSLRKKMLERGLDPAVLMDEDGLVINKETEREVLQLLNEDLWTGDFSGEQYAASRKARRS